MNCTTIAIDMPVVIHKLARIDDDHQLEALALDHSADCRGLCRDASQLHSAAELLRAQRVANALALFLGLDRSEIEPLVRSVLLAHPRRESALRLIDEYARDAKDASTVAMLKLERERQDRERTKRA